MWTMDNIAENTLLEFAAVPETPVQRAVMSVTGADPEGFRRAMHRAGVNLRYCEILAGIYRPADANVIADDPTNEAGEYVPGVVPEGYLEIRPDVQATLAGIILLGGGETDSPDFWGGVLGTYYLLPHSWTLRMDVVERLGVLAGTFTGGYGPGTATNMYDRMVSTGADNKWTNEPGEYAEGKGPIRTSVLGDVQYFVYGGPATRSIYVTKFNMQVMELHDIDAETGRMGQLPESDLPYDGGMDREVLAGLFEYGEVRSVGYIDRGYGSIPADALAGLGYEAAENGSTVEDGYGRTSRNMFGLGLMRAALRSGLVDEGAMAAAVRDIILDRGVPGFLRRAAMYAAGGLNIVNIAGDGDVSGVIAETVESIPTLYLVYALFGHCPYNEDTLVEMLRHSGDSDALSDDLFTTCLRKAGFGRIIEDVALGAVRRIVAEDGPDTAEEFDWCYVRDWLKGIVRLSDAWVTRAIGYGKVSPSTAAKMFDRFVSKMPRGSKKAAAFVARYYNRRFRDMITRMGVHDETRLKTIQSIRDAFRHTYATDEEYLAATADARVKTAPVKKLKFDLPKLDHKPTREEQAERKAMLERMKAEEEERFRAENEEYSKYNPIEDELREREEDVSADTVAKVYGLLVGMRDRAVTPTGGQMAALRRALSDPDMVIDIVYAFIRDDRAGGLLKLLSRIDVVPDRSTLSAMVIDLGTDQDTLYTILDSMFYPVLSEMDDGPLRDAVCGAISDYDVIRRIYGTAVSMITGNTGRIIEGFAGICTDMGAAGMKPLRTMISMFMGDVYSTHTGPDGKATGTLDRSEVGIRRAGVLARSLINQVFKHNDLFDVDKCIDAEAFIGIARDEMAAVKDKSISPVICDSLFLREPNLGDWVRELGIDFGIRLFQTCPKLGEGACNRPEMPCIRDILMSDSMQEYTAGIPVDSYMSPIGIYEMAAMSKVPDVRLDMRYFGGVVNSVVEHIKEEYINNPAVASRIVDRLGLGDYLTARKGAAVTGDGKSLINTVSLNGVEWGTEYYRIPGVAGTASPASGAVMLYTADEVPGGIPDGWRLPTSAEVGSIAPMAGKTIRMDQTGFIDASGAGQDRYSACIWRAPDADMFEDGPQICAISGGNGYDDAVVMDPAGCRAAIRLVKA